MLIMDGRLLPSSLIGGRGSRLAFTRLSRTTKICPTSLSIAILSCPTNNKVFPLNRIRSQRLQFYGTTMSESKPISLIESAKAQAAERAVKEHFSTSFTHVGIGSGSTVVHVVQSIAKALEASKPDHEIKFIPTGAQSRQTILKAGLRPTSLEEIDPSIAFDVAFDGADEVDTEMNCVKGGGAALFQEKCVVLRARKFICVADFRKLSPNLLTNWPSIPIEVAPMASQDVLSALRALGSTNPAIRPAISPPHHSENDPTESEVVAPLRTDQGFYIIDAPFSKPLRTSTETGEGWEVVSLAKAIRQITGVLEVGIFSGDDGIDKADKVKSEGKELKGGRVGGEKPVMAYFGMEDGSVSTRIRKGGVPGVNP